MNLSPTDQAWIAPIGITYSNTGLLGLCWFKQHCCLWIGLSVKTTEVGNDAESDGQAHKTYLIELIFSHHSGLFLTSGVLGSSKEVASDYAANLKSYVGAAQLSQNTTSTHAHLCNIS